MNKKKQPSKPVINLAISILGKIDKDESLEKEEVVAILRQYLEQVTDLLYIQAIEYLLNSFENLEEKLEELEVNRDKQEKTLKAQKLDKETFTNRINLDSDEREPDENDRIFTTGKKLFSGKNQFYKRADKIQQRKVMKKFQPKSDPKKLKKYNI